MSSFVLTSAASLPFFHLGSIDTGVVPIQSFGILVALGVLIGAYLLRRYAEWHGVSDENIRSLLAWVTISGFLGAHWFDVIAYQWDKLDAPWHWWPVGATTDPPAFGNGPGTPNGWLPLPLRLWDGISSYGGFVGGSIGFAAFVWWKRLPARLFADITIVGLLSAFTIGRIGCTVVSDHIGAAIDPSSWYSFLGVEYPTSGDNLFGPIRDLLCKGPTCPTSVGNLHPDWIQNGHLLAWNLGLVEFLYLIPVNAVVLWLAFRANRRPNAGFLVVVTGLLYAPVRFFLDFLRPEDSDPRHWGLTFAQWAALASFAVAAYVATLVAKSGEPAPVVAPTSKDAQVRLKLILKEADEEADEEGDHDKNASAKKAADKKAADKKKAASKAVVEDKKAFEDPAGITMVQGAANVPFMVPRDIVDSTAKALEDEEHARAAYYLPIRIKGEQKMVIGLDLDAEGEARWTEIADKLSRPALLLDSKQLLDVARTFDRKIYPKESDAGAAAVKLDKPGAKPFKDGSTQADVKLERETALQTHGLGEAGAPLAATLDPKDPPKARVAKVDAKVDAKAEDEAVEAKIEAKAEEKAAETKVEAKAEEKAVEAKIEAKAEEEAAETKIEAKAEEKSGEAKAEEKVVEAKIEAKGTDPKTD